MIEALDNNDGEETLFAKIMNQNLEIGDDEKRLLLDKYCRR
ncbi:putative regulatory domain protein [Bacteroides fragilis str. DS-208]|nr:putative regulatory domain protein [Bacteroides fragilis str. DS-208]